VTISGPICCSKVNTLAIIDHRLQCLPASCGDSRDLHVLLGIEHRAQARCEDRMVVGEDEPNHRWAPRSSGRAAVT
jgi:hypothetical protein